MNKAIIISYLCSGNIFSVPLTYTIDVTNNTQTIVCMVATKELPQWLQLKKFDLVSKVEMDVYMPMYNEVNNGKNLDTLLFIDKAYTDIMTHEHLEVKESTESYA